MKTYAKYLSPLAFVLSCLLCYGLVAFLFTRISDLGGTILGLVMSVAMILAVFLVAVPCYCFLYGRKTLQNEKRKFVFVPYNALILTLAYLLPFGREGETYAYSAILFLWACLWSALPLLFRKKENS